VGSPFLRLNIIVEDDSSVTFYLEDRPDSSYSADATAITAAGAAVNVNGLVNKTVGGHAYMDAFAGIVPLFIVEAFQVRYVLDDGTVYIFNAPGAEVNPNLSFRDQRNNRAALSVVSDTSDPIARLLFALGADLAETAGGFIEGGGIILEGRAAATTPGNVIAKVEVFDKDGASIGFLPIYDAIT